jgi:hypothetical protein
MLLQPLESRVCRSWGTVKPKKGRTGPGEACIDSHVLRAGAARKNALDFTEKGMLRKDDLFKVVFDPGSDKRKDWILGPVFSLG